MPSRKIFYLLVLFLISLVASVKCGAVHIPLKEFFTTDALNIIQNIRLPRTIAAVFVGAALSISGAVLQSLLRNPLADSYTLGISGGSALGASLAMHISILPGYLLIPGFSFLGALLAVGFVLVLAAQTLKFESRTLILVGIMTSLFLGAISVFFISILPADKSQGALTWLMGEFGSSRDRWALGFFIFSLIPIVFIFTKTSVLDALSLGDIKAISLGYKPAHEKAFLILAATLLTSLAISISGLIGFIGLVSPHLARRYLKTALHKKTLLASMLIGSILLLVADTIGRVIIENQEVPAGSLAAVIGAPVLIYLLLERKNVFNE